MVVISEFEGQLKKLEEIIDNASCWTWNDFTPISGSENVVDINSIIRPIGIRARNYEISLFDNNDFEWYRKTFPANEDIVKNFIEDLEKQDWKLAARNIKEIFPNMSLRTLYDYAEGFDYFTRICKDLGKEKNDD